MNTYSSIIIFKPFCIFFMNWCYDCIWKSRIGNAIIIISKNKISRNIRIFVNEFCGYVSAFCGFIRLRVNHFFHDFITFNLRQTKKTNPSYNFPLLQFCQGGAYILWLLSSVDRQCCDSLVPFHYIEGIPSVFMTLEKNSLKTCSVFIVFYNVVILYDL